jgi:hypothetical protein
MALSRLTQRDLAQAKLQLASLPGGSTEKMRISKKLAKSVVGK